MLLSVSRTGKPKCLSVRLTIAIWEVWGIGSSDMFIRLGCVLGFCCVCGFHSAFSDSILLPPTHSVDEINKITFKHGRTTHDLENAACIEDGYQRRSDMQVSARKATCTLRRL